MPFVAIPNTAKLEIPFIHPARSTPVVLVTHVRSASPGPYPYSEMSALADDLFGLIAVQFPSIMPSNCAIDPIVATDITLVTGEQATAAGASVPGTDTHSILPPANAVCISAYTSTRGRSYRGRSYFPCVSEASLDVNGNLNSTRLTEYTGYWNTMWAQLYSDLGWTHAVASRKLAVSTPIANYITRIEVRSQRRRESDHV